IAIGSTLPANVAPYPGAPNAANSGNLNGGTDPLLGQLKYNGGPTFTMAPANTSPVINKGDNSVQPAPSTDQRGPGFARVASPNGGPGTLPDMGAVEVQPPTVLIITPAIPGPTNSSSVNFIVYFNQ